MYKTKTSWPLDIKKIVEKYQLYLFAARIHFTVKLKLNFDLDETHVQFRVSQYLCKTIFVVFRPPFLSKTPLCHNPFAIE